MRIYLHTEGRVEPDAIEAEPGATVAELVADRPGVTHVLREDEDEPLSLDASVDEARIADRSHVFAGRRHRIDVEVQFNGQAKSRELSAANRVERVFRWAVGPQGFQLGKADAVEHTLALCGSADVPPSDALLGSLPGAESGALCFSLIPKHRFEG